MLSKPTTPASTDEILPTDEGPSTSGSTPSVTYQDIIDEQDYIPDLLEKEPEDIFRGRCIAL